MPKTARATCKGDWIVRIQITDPEAYPAYIEAAQPVFER